MKKSRPGKFEICQVRQKIAPLNLEGEDLSVVYPVERIPASDDSFPKDQLLISISADMYGVVEFTWPEPSSTRRSKKKPRSKRSR